MKKFIVGFLMVWVCLLAVPEKSQAMEFNEAEIKARLAELYQEILRLEALIAEQNKPAVPAHYGTYTYSDSDNTKVGFSATYQADTEFSVTKTTAADYGEVFTDFEEFGGSGKFINWTFHQENKAAGSVGAVDSTVYQLFEVSMGFLDFLASVIALDPEMAAEGVSFEVSPGFKQQDGFSYKTLSFADESSSGGAIIGFRSFGDSALGGVQGGLVVSISWGNNLDQGEVDTDEFIFNLGDTEIDGVHFTDEVSARIFFDGLTKSINYSEAALINLVN